MGPMANARRRETVHELVEDARKRGGRVLAGGEIPDGPGFFYPPTVLVDVSEDARLLHEEPFGPVAPILPFTALDDAIELANALPYGLSGCSLT